MFAGVMSPARPWFRLTTHNPALLESHAVKVWLAEVEKLMRSIFNQGNLYNMAPVMLGELLLFGTGCMLHVDDFSDVARFYTQTVGSYMIAQNDRFVVDTLVREFQMTTTQLVSNFGLNDVSTQVKQAFDLGNYENWYDVVHFIEPNPEHDIKKLNNKFKRFRSVHFEPSDKTPDKKKFLKVSGFTRFPAYCPRWDVAGEDIYGTDCPGMTSLGDIKQLQMAERRKAQAIAKQSNPPLQGPPSIRNVESVPGGFTHNMGATGGKIEPIYAVNPQVNELNSDIKGIERRIEDNFFVDLFLAITNMEGIQPKNQLELSERTGEKLLQVGPVLERVHGEFLEGLIDNTFDQIIEGDILPLPPEEIQGEALKVEFVSSLAQAQKSIAVGGIDQLAAFVTGLAGVGYESVLDKFDADQAVDEYSDLIGGSPKLIVPDEEVAEQREARAQAEQQQQQQAMMLEVLKSGGGAIKDLASADLEGDNVASRTANILQEAAGNA